MNEKMIKHIKNYCIKENYECNEPDDYLETLRECGKELHYELTHKSRWWNNLFCVSKLDGMLIGYNNAETTGDDKPQDLGWEFDINSICEVERHEETVLFVTYTKKKQERVE